MNKDGISTLQSRHSVDGTLDRLTRILESKGITVFTVVDHSGEAAKVGLQMPPTRLVIFGNPRAGTPVMLAAPSVALDLPLKILVWQDGQGDVWLSYNDPAYLAARHHVPHELVPNLGAAGDLAAAAAG